MGLLANPVEMVRNAEQRYEDVINGAYEKAGQIIENAKKTAERMAAEGLKTSADKLEDSISAAQQANSTLMDEFLIDLGAEVRSMKDSAKIKTATAAELVFHSLI